MPKLTDEVLAGWLRPATVTLDSQELVTLRAAIAMVGAKLTSETAFHVAALAYNVGTDEALTWFGDRIREAQPAFVNVGQDALIARLACCSLLAALDSGEASGALLSLLAQSAAFLGGAAAEPELETFVEASQRDLAAARRARPKWSPITGTVAKIMTDGPRSVAEGQEAETVEQVQERAINDLASALDLLASQVEQRGDLTDEEYNTLWWSYTRRSETTGSAWTNVGPLPKRIVLVANELGDKVSLVPSPPMVRGLLALALEGQADEEVTLSDVMVAAAENGVAVARGVSSRLLPISMAVARISELGADDSTWSSVLAKTMRLEVCTVHSALDTAMQLIREREIGALL